MPNFNKQFKTFLSYDELSEHTQTDRQNRKRDMTYVLINVLFVLSTG